jgi:hypothetical protein
LARTAAQSDAQARAVYLNVCLPSRWRPHDMLSKNFVGLHARVPREPGFDKDQRLQLASQLFGRPCARFVWGMTPDARLDQHPDRVAGATPGWHDASTGYLRVERQSIVPLCSGSASRPDVCLFLIRLYVYPFTRLGTDRCAQLRQHLAGMSEAMRRYKGLLGYEAQVQRMLAAHSNSIS